MAFLLHSTKPSRERESLIARKSENLASCRRKASDVAAEDEEEQYDRENHREGSGAAVQEELEVRNLGVDCVVERADAEEHGDEYNNAHADVEEEGPPHHARDDEGSILDFFADVDDGVSSLRGQLDCLQGACGLLGCSIAR